MVTILKITGMDDLTGNFPFRDELLPPTVLHGLVGSCGIRLNDTVKSKTGPTLHVQTHRQPPPSHFWSVSYGGRVRLVTHPRSLPDVVVYLSGTPNLPLPRGFRGFVWSG